MKILWLCNMMPGKVKQALEGDPNANGLWVDQMLDGMRQAAGVQMYILCPGNGERGALGEDCQFQTFSLGVPYVYESQLEETFSQVLRSFQPDVIHIWGTEYAHTLAMVNACQKEGVLDHTGISIQGLCSVYAGHYMEGLPHAVCHSYTLRDALRQDNIYRQMKKFQRRGELEVQALRKVSHIIGRTDWDKACARQINPQTTYHFCNETLRRDFYGDSWQYDRCQKHRIFASSCAYPVKGFHYLLEAMPEILKHYPDATLTVTGKDLRRVPAYRLGSYQKYLLHRMEQLGLMDKVEFLGGLNAQQMKEAYLQANVFVLPSTIENSPNSLGEAMLLGVPCVAADVGGVSNMLTHRREGFLYQPTAAYMLAYYVQLVFSMEEQACHMGAAAAEHARLTHNREKNLKDMLAIYDCLAKEGKQ